jgi:hypothetical protein
MTVKSKNGPPSASAPRVTGAGAVGSAASTCDRPSPPNWSLLLGRRSQSPVDEAIRRQLSEIFFPNDSVSIDISSSSPLPFAAELRDMFATYAEKEVQQFCCFICFAGMMRCLCALLMQFSF